MINIKFESSWPGMDVSNDDTGNDEAGLSAIFDHGERWASDVADLDVDLVEVVADRQGRHSRRLVSQQDLSNVEVATHLFVDQTMLRQEGRDEAADEGQGVRVDSKTNKK